MDPVPPSSLLPAPLPFLSKESLLSLSRASRLLTVDVETICLLTGCRVEGVLLQRVGHYYAVYKYCNMERSRKLHMPLRIIGRLGGTVRRGTVEQRRFHSIVFLEVSKKKIPHLVLLFVPLVLRFLGSPWSFTSFLFARSIQRETVGCESNFPVPY